MTLRDEKNRRAVEDAKIIGEEWAAFVERLLRLYEGAEALGMAMFMGVPERWLAKPKWRCLKGHVSSVYLKNEEKGAVCLACFERVRLTTDFDVETPGAGRAGA